MKAFVLGAGLGTRLRPLTARRPKPLVPIHGKPLITFAFDHLIANGITSFVVNTHHCPEAYSRILGNDANYRGMPLTLRHEPVLLDTGGGIKNVQDLLRDDVFVVYNGDVLADFPLQPAIDAHRNSGNVATLVLRSTGGPLHIQSRDKRVTDIRQTLGQTGDPSFLFTGISILSPGIFDHIPADQIVSIIPIYLDLLKGGTRIGAWVEDSGLWLDLGTRESYLDAHARFQSGGDRLSYTDPMWPRPCPTLRSVVLEGFNSISPSAHVGEGAMLRDCVIWENATVAAGSQLSRCIVSDGETMRGTFQNQDK